MKRKNFQLRYFKCPYCGSIQTAAKSMGMMTGFGHVKTMLCFRCMQTRDLVQVSEWENQLTTSPE